MSPNLRRPPNLTAPMPTRSNLVAAQYPRPPQNNKKTDREGQFLFEGVGGTGFEPVTPCL